MLRCGLVTYLFALALADPCTTGMEAIRRRDLDAAQAALVECTKTQPGHLEAQLMLCGVYQIQGNADRLLEASLDGAKRFPGEKRFYLTAGTYAGRQRQFARATQVMDAAVTRWPDDPKLRALAESVHLGLGMELLDKGDNTGAEKILRRAVELAPDDAEALLNLGRAQHNLHHGAAALATFDRLLKASPQTPLAHFHRGLTLQAMGEADAAIESLSKEIAASAYGPAYLVRALALIAKGDWAAALPDAEAAVQKLPDDAKAHYTQARCLLRAGREKEAEPALRRAIELSPADPAPLNALVRLLLQSGRQDEAAPLAAKAAELGKKERTAAKGEMRFQ
jgi:Flp pilus assembly protein TadD